MIMVVVGDDDGCNSEVMIVEVKVNAMTGSQSGVRAHAIHGL